MMREMGKYYDVNDFNSWKRKQGDTCKGPPRANVLFAANYIRNALEERDFNWAAMGRLAMLCLGSPRAILDIHLAYDDRDFEQIKAILEADQRVRLPKRMSPLFPVKVLIRTGPLFKDAGCTENADVELDLVPQGSYGTPQRNLLRTNQVLVRLNRDGIVGSYRCLNILYLIRTTLAYCNNEHLAWDPKQDIVFLCQSYSKEIETIRVHLDQNELHERFFSTSYFSSLPTGEQRRCSMTLLTSQFAPAPTIPFSTSSHWTPKPIAAPLQVPGPRPQPQNCTPRQGSCNPPQTEAMPNTARIPKGNLPVPLTQNLVSSTGQRSHLHSRTTSAPDATANVDKPGSSQTTQLCNSRPKSMESRGPFQQPLDQLTVHNAQNVSKPRVIHNRTPPPMTAAQMMATPITAVPNTGTGITRHGAIGRGVNNTASAPNSRLDRKGQQQNQGQSQSRFVSGPQQPVASLPFRQQPEHYVPISTSVTRQPPPPQDGRLRVVGPEGLYSSPTKPPAFQQKKAIPPSEPVGLQSVQAQRPLQPVIPVNVPNPKPRPTLQIPGNAPGYQSAQAPLRGRGISTDGMRMQPAPINLLHQKPLPKQPNRDPLLSQPLHVQRGERSDFNPIDGSRRSSSSALQSINHSANTQGKPTGNKYHQDTHSTNVQRQPNPGPPNTYRRHSSDAIPPAKSTSANSPAQAHQPSTPSSTYDSPGESSNFNSERPYSNSFVPPVKQRQTKLQLAIPKSQQDHVILKPLNMITSGADAGTPSTGRSIPEDTPSSVHITERIHNYYYQGGDEVRRADMQTPVQAPPKKLVTGYEAFTHGPYSAVDSPSPAMSGYGSQGGWSPNYSRSKSAPAVVTPVKTYASYYDISTEPVYIEGIN